jgi:hypothetical protein
VREYPIKTQIGYFPNREGLEEWFEEWKPGTEIEAYFDFTLISDWKFIFTPDVEMCFSRHGMQNRFGVYSYSQRFDDLPAKWIDILVIIDNAMQAANESIRKSNANARS